MAPLTIQTIKNQYFLTQLKTFMTSNHTVENFLFLFDKSSNEVLYTKYIKVGVSLEVNIPAVAMRDPLDKLAAQKKWSAMSAGIKTAREEIQQMVNQGPLPAFLKTPAGKQAHFMLSAGVDGSKVTQMIGLLAVFEKPRTPQDKLDAHVAMQKLSALAKLNPALRELGLEPPARPVLKKGDPAKALKILGVPAKLMPEMKKQLLAYNTATTPEARDLVLKKMEGVAKDIAKHDAIIAALKSSGML